MADADYRAWVEVLPSFDAFNGDVEKGVSEGIAVGSGQKIEIVAEVKPSISGNLVSGLATGFAASFGNTLLSSAGAGFENGISGALQTAFGRAAPAAGRAGAAILSSNLGAGLSAGAAGVGAAAGPIGLAIAAGIGAVAITSSIFDAIRAGFDSAVSYVQNSVNLAAELEQNIGAVTAVFKENAGQVEAWSQESAESLGLSRNSYLQFSAVVGAQLKNLNIPFDEVAGRTDGLITLGADLAAQFGGTTSDAVAALSSLLRGERDPIERYGVSIKQADINARVAAMGLGELTLEQQRQAEIMATLAILSEQTADAQGAFSRETDTFLNVQQRMQAVLEDTATELGTELLPILTEVMGFVKDELVPIWQDFNAEVGPELRAALEDAWPRLQELIERLLPLLPPVLMLIIDALVLFGNVTSDTIERVDAVIGTFTDLFALLSGDLSVDQFSERFTQRMQDMASAQQSLVSQILTSFTELGGQILTAATSIASNLYTSGRAMIQKLIDGIKSKLTEAGNAAKSVLEYVKGFFPQSPAQRGPFSGSGWTSLADSGGAIMAQFASGLVPVDVPLGVDSFLPVPAAVRSPDASAVSGQGTQPYVSIDPSQMRELLSAFAVTLLTQDTVIAATADKGTAYQTALGAS